MGVSTLTFGKATVIPALSRSGGTPVASYRYGAELPDAMRRFKHTGTGVGHVYIRVDRSGGGIVGKGSVRMDRTVFDSTETAVNASVEITTTAPVKAVLTRLDQDPQEWLKHIPLAGDYHGFAQRGDTRNKIMTTAINMRSHGDAFSIRSCHPDSFTKP